MKFISCLVFVYIIIFVTACASNTVLVDRKFRDYSPCEPTYCGKMNFWLTKCESDIQVPNNDKLYCFHYCEKGSWIGKCKEYGLDSIDPNDPEIRNLRFHLKVPENP